MTALFIVIIVFSATYLLGMWLVTPSTDSDERREMED